MKRSLHLSVLALLTASTLSGQQPTDSAPRASGPPFLGDSILGTGALGRWIAIERGFAVTSLEAARDNIGRATSLPLALQGRVPGVSVSEGQGFLGSSSRVWLRGPGSVMVNEPLLIIDGARTHAGNPNRFFEDRELPSRLEDINPEIIERIDVLRGVAASAIYGPGASKGVILVTTKRGQPGPARWTAFAESGPLTEATDFPTNFGTLGVSTANGTPVSNCSLAAQGAGTCTPTTRQSWNPLERASPFRTGWSTGAGLGVTGGTSMATYRVGAGHDRATGIYENDRGSATDAHVNLSLAAAPPINVRFSGAYRTEEFRRPTVSWIPLGLFGESVDDPVRRGYGFFDEGPIVEQGRRQDSGRRLTMALNAAWMLRPSLRATAIVAYDESRVQEHFRLRRAGIGFPDLPGDSVTEISHAGDWPTARTGAIEIENTYAYQGAVARSAIGVQYLRDDDRANTFSGVIPDNPDDLGGESRSRMDLRRASLGVYLRQHFGWQRFLVTGSIRADDPKHSGIGIAYAPSVDVSWIPVSRQHRGLMWLGDLRLRAAYGRGGAHLIQSAEPDNSFFGIGPSDETAERVGEVEIGADATMLDERVQLSVTGYRATNDQALVLTQRPPGGGGGGEMVSNDARIRTSGVEMSLDARLIEVRGLVWDMGLGIAAHDTKVVSLPGPPLIIGPAAQGLWSGQELGEYHAGSYTFTDANGDGLISQSEISVDANAFTQAGSPFPTYEAGLQTDVMLGSIHVRALVDRRSGQTLYNQVGRFRCGSVPNCVQQHDPATPLAEQAAVVAARNVLGPWLEDASYTKLREVAIMFALPRAWTGSARDARLTLAGRNLFTWTSYSGLDPEITGTERNSLSAVGDTYQPALRSFTARLDLSW